MIQIKDVTKLYPVRRDGEDHSRKRGEKWAPPVMLFARWTIFRCMWRRGNGFRSWGRRGRGNRRW